MTYLVSHYISAECVFSREIFRARIWAPKFLNLKIFIRKRKDGEHCFSIDLQISLVSFSLSISTSVLSTPVTGAGAQGLPPAGQIFYNGGYTASLQVLKC